MKFWKKKDEKKEAEKADVEVLDENGNPIETEEAPKKKERNWKPIVIGGAIAGGVLATIAGIIVKSKTDPIYLDDLDDDDSIEIEPDEDGDSDEESEENEES